MIVKRVMTRRIAYVLIVTTMLLGGLAISSSSASAHAVLESTSPTDQAVVPTAPKVVTLTFSESVTLVPGAVRVFNNSGQRVDEGVAQQDEVGRRVTVQLKKNLAAGSYAVAWKVISEDSHPIHGGFTFSIQRAGRIGGLDQYLSMSSQPGWETTGIILRALTYFGSFLTVGTAFFLAFVAQRQDRWRPRWVLPSALLTLLALVAQLPVLATLATSQGPASLFSDGVLGDLLDQGVWLTIAGTAVAVVIALLALLTNDRWSKRFALASVILVALAFAASGHTRSTHPTWLVILVDVAHVIAGVIWVGGLGALISSVRQSRKSQQDPVEAATQIARFSGVAAFSIVVVGAAGFVLAFVEVRSLHGLVATGYGRLVLAKVALVVALAGLGAMNRFRLVPAVQAKPNHAVAWRYFGRTLRLEMVGMIAILGVTGALVQAIPARTQVERSAVYSASASLGAGSANLVIDPARTGRIALHVYLLDAQGRSDTTVENVQIDVFHPKLSIGPMHRTLQRGGPGHFLSNGTIFTVPGTWTVTVRVRVDEFTERSATFRVNVNR